MAGVNDGRSKDNHVAKYRWVNTGRYSLPGPKVQTAQYSGYIQIYALKVLGLYITNTWSPPCMFLYPFGIYFRTNLTHISPKPDKPKLPHARHVSELWELNVILCTLKPADKAFPVFPSFKETCLTTCKLNAVHDMNLNGCHRFIIKWKNRLISSTGPSQPQRIFTWFLYVHTCLLHKRKPFDKHPQTGIIARNTLNQEFEVSRRDLIHPSWKYSYCLTWHVNWIFQMR